MFQQLKFSIKINLFDSWQSLCKFTALSWLCDTPVKWKVSNWIQCKCVFIWIKSVMKHFVICVTISHNNRFNFKHVSRYFFTYCRVNPYFPEKLNDVATIQPFVQIFYFPINSTKKRSDWQNGCIVPKILLIVFLAVNPSVLNSPTVDSVLVVTKAPAPSEHKYSHCRLERKSK